MRGLAWPQKSRPESRRWAASRGSERRRVPPHTPSPRSRPCGLCSLSPRGWVRPPQLRCYSHGGISFKGVCLGSHLPSERLLIKADPALCCFCTFLPGLWAGPRIPHAEEGLPQLGPACARTPAHSRGQRLPGWPQGGNGILPKHLLCPRGFSNVGSLNFHSNSGGSFVTILQGRMPGFRKV